VGEHLREGRRYAQQPDGSVAVHFTISDGAEENFAKTAGREQARLPESTFNISYSFQDPSTDTIALDEKGNPFRLESGELLFRPGGHGSLIKNLNERPGDIFFIKNIDNVQKEDMNHWTVESFTSLAGLILETRDSLKELKNQLINGAIEDENGFIEKLTEISGHDYSGISQPLTSRKDDILRLLNSPIRICGMVKNEGEPGGGPFWVKQSKGVKSLQIVESAQINLEDTRSKEIFDSSTHFNPVFLVCLKKDLEGNALDLKEYVDQDTYFIAEKSLEGRKLKALEHPGLWNGAMAKWVTRFIEIPPECFTPVKTVNDLLRDAHR